MSENVIRRLDKDGHMYFMDYKGDYYDPKIIEEVIRRNTQVPGCSCFLTHNEKGEVLTCRNYDLGHRVSAEDPSYTGLNVVMHCKPQGKYESIGIADAVWLDPVSPLYQTGGPDLPDFDPEMFLCLPYACMDGLNEKGLSANLLKVVIKKGDQPAMAEYSCGILLRNILDNCASVDETVELVKNFRYRPEDWQSVHVFVTDANGKSVIMESRNGKLSIAETDIASNFYLCSNDAEDSYRNGALHERAVILSGLDGKSRYSYGSGHGYHRFACMLSQLEMYQDRSSEEYRTVMPESQAKVILRSVIQNTNTRAAGVTMTQYSAIYNNTAGTMKVWSYQDFSTSFSFDVTGKEISE